MARAKGISKAKGYRARIFTIEYDLNAMIEAYGLDFVVDLATKIASGEVKQRDCRQEVDRWGAHLQLEADAQWAEQRHNYFKPEPTLEEMAA